MNCSGDGNCLVQTDFNCYDVTDCIHNCQPVQCVNYKLCETELPEWCAKKKNSNPIHNISTTI